MTAASLTSVIVRRPCSWMFSSCPKGKGCTSGSPPEGYVANDSMMSRRWSFGNISRRRSGHSHAPPKAPSLYCRPSSVNLCVWMTSSMTQYWPSTHIVCGIHPLHPPLSLLPFVHLWSSFRHMEMYLGWCSAPLQKFWRRARPESVGRLPCSTAVYACAFSSDGCKIRSTCSDGRRSPCTCNPAGALGMQLHG